MKNGLLGLTLALATVFVFGTGAAIIDKETKESVVGLNAKFSRLGEEERAHHLVQMQLLKEQHEIIQKLNQRIDGFERQVRSVSEASRRPVAVVAQPESAPTPPPPIIEQPPAAVPTAPPMQPVQATVQQTQEPQPALVKAAEPEAPSVPEPQPVATLTTAQPQVVSPMSNTQSLALLAFMLSGVSVLILIVMLVRMKMGEDRMKQMFWRSEMDSLRDEVIRGRPHLKIHSEGEKVEVVNTGESVAEEVKVYVGPAAASMKQKLKISSRMPAGEKSKIDLPSQLSEDPLYATLEYKHPTTGRVYKEQYLLKLDRVTGHLSPLAQAS